MASPAANPRMRIEVLLEDSEFLVLAKPAGVATQPGAGHRDDTLLNGAFAAYRRELEPLGQARDYGLVHRLDLQTSGCVLLARSAHAYDSLRGQFASRSVSKRYLALVHGRLPSAEGTVTLPLAEVRRGGMKVSVAGRAGEEAWTGWRTLGACATHALIEVELRTGRLHQIRAHMALAGAAVEGDTVYRPLLPPNTSPPRGKPPLLMLHAWRLGFDHPASGARVEAIAPPPSGFIARLEELLPGAGARIGAAR